jgi:elongation factor G
MARNLTNIRNIGIIAHIDAGKTTVTEKFLFFSGAKHRAGGVDQGTTETDDDPEEQERGITIYAACVTFPWKDVHINLLDTPGHVDFTAEVERCLRVLDGAVVVFSGREGVEAQSETVWRQADKYGVPRIAFINKLDREGADFERTLRQIETRLPGHPVVLEIPVGQGPSHSRDPLRGVIDLITMKMLTFPAEQEGKNVVSSTIPDELRDEAELWRGQMLEKLYNFSDELMELALQEEPVPEALIRKVIREATISMQIQPVLCGTALHNIGVQPVLDAVQYYLPSPADRPPVTGTNPVKKDLVETRKPLDDEPFCGLVFKILPAKTGDFYWIRIYSGTLDANSRVQNPGKDKKENVSQLWQIHATKREREGKRDSVGAGDIVGVIGPRYSITGDTLCDPKAPILLESITFPETVMSMAIEPETTEERKKLGETLEMLKKQDPTFRAAESEETGQTLISGMGELHLEVIKHRLLRDFSLNVKVHKPRVSYRETIAKAVEVTGECHRVMAGQQLFAKLKIRMEPFKGGKQSVTVLDKSEPGQVPFELMNAAVDELRSAAGGGGVIGGFPLINLRITVLGGETAEVGSTDVAFAIAANDAFEKALREGGPVLMEPIMKLEITTPEDYLGDFINDLQRRRATIARTESLGEITQIEAHAPLAELFGYSGAMRSLSQGRAGCSMEPMEYAPAPPGTYEF